MVSQSVSVKILIGEEGDVRQLHMLDLSVFPCLVLGWEQKRSA